MCPLNLVVALDRLPTSGSFANAGVARVVLGTVAAESPLLLKDLVSNFSSRSASGLMRATAA